MNKRGSVLVPVLVCVTAISIAIASFLFWQNQNLQNEQTFVTLTPTPSLSPAKKDNSDWKQFEFKENPVSFKYPSNLELKYFPTDINGNFGGDRMATHENAVLKKGETKILGVNPNQLGLDFPVSSQTTKEQVVVDGKQVTKTISPDGTYFLLLNYGDKNLFISCYAEPAICNQILSTFRFTNESANDPVLENKAKQAMTNYLDGYKNPSSGEMQIADYRIDKISNITEKNDNLNFHVIFSIKPISSASEIVGTANGSKDSSGWIINKSGGAQAKLTPTGYSIIGLGTGFGSSE